MGGTVPVPPMANGDIGVNDCHPAAAEVAAATKVTTEAEVTAAAEFRCGGGRSPE